MESGGGDDHELDQGSEYEADVIFGKKVLYISSTMGSSHII